MLLRLTVPVLALLYATGCCCCGGGGGGSSSSSSSWSDALEEEIAERVAEELIEAATDIDELDIDESTGKITIKTDEGEAEIVTGEDAGTFQMKGANGETFDLAVGGAAKVPAGFPYTLPTPSTVLMSNTSVTPDGEAFMVAAQHDGLSVDAVVRHWEKQLSGLGKLQRTEMSADGGKMVTLTAEKGGTSVAIQAADGQVTSTVIAAPK
ncbi:MAG: hypothetical protein EP330_05140 [Deltaproteobacteria bacterium]|nr:MAG: hypothetical protein EP330_05140 [Deltaproteobacteria bacterium]